MNSIIGAAVRDEYRGGLALLAALLRLLCDRMKEQVWWWAMPEYSLLPRVHALAHSSAATPDTAVYYTNTVNWLRDTHPAYIKRMQIYFTLSEREAP